jgi:hypothetical protein
MIFAVLIAELPWERRRLAGSVRAMAAEKTKELNGTAPA